MSKLIKNNYSLASDLAAKAEAVPYPSYATPISNAQTKLIDATPKVNAQTKLIDASPKVNAQTKPSYPPPRDEAQMSRTTISDPGTAINDRE